MRGPDALRHVAGGNGGRKLMCELIEFPGLYLPSHEQAICDLDNANSDMEFWAKEFAKDPLYEHAAARYKAARERFHKATDLAWDARFREVNTALYERGRI